VLPLQPLSNLLAAWRESDFSIRARGASGDDPLGAVMLEVNVLASTLHDQRLGALEAGALLRTVMVEIDVAVFTFDGAHMLRLVNRAGERILAQPAEQLLGRTAGELGLGACLAGHSPRTLRHQWSRSAQLRRRDCRCRRGKQRHAGGALRPPGIPGKRGQPRDLPLSHHALWLDVKQRPFGPARAAEGTDPRARAGAMRA
jgi:PAS domain-containing protein